MLFTIITPVRNCRVKLAVTAQSVLGQDYIDYEYIVVDCNSNDGTKEFLEMMKTPKLKFVSEDDSGIYDAMNKGIHLAKGRYIIFLGAGDKLMPEILTKVSKFLPNHDFGFIYGDVLLGERRYDGKFSKTKLCHQNVSHQAIFYGRKIFRDYGCFDLKYRSLSDWAFNLMCFGKQRIRKKYIPLVISDYEVGGISSLGDADFESDKYKLIRSSLGYFVIFRLELTKVGLRFCYHWISIIRPFVPRYVLDVGRQLRERARVPWGCP